jgi:hypothetical protein
VFGRLTLRQGDVPRRPVVAIAPGTVVTIRRRIARWLYPINLEFYAASRFDAFCSDRPARPRLFRLALPSDSLFSVGVGLAGE